MNYYALDKLIKITVNKPYPARWFKYKPKKKIFGIVIRKEGYYGTIYNSFQKNIPDYHQVINGKLFEKPEVVLYFQNEYVKTYYFDSIEHAENFAEDVRTESNLKFIS